MPQALYHALETPFIPDLKAVSQMNLIANNPITTSDIDIAEKILGLMLVPPWGNCQTKACTGYGGPSTNLI
jgi:hypothetical protein